MSANTLARLVVQLEAQSASYQAGLEKATRQLRKFRTEQNAALGAIQKQFIAFGQNIARSFAIGSVTTALYGLSASIKDAVKAGDDLAKFSSKTGLSAKAVSELAYAAKQADIDLGGLETGIKKMQVSISNLGSGSKTQVETFAALGLTFRDLKDLQPDQQLELIAEQISKLKDPADRTRAAVELFGKAGADLLPLFEQGAEGIQKLRAETPHVFSEEDLKRLSDADAAMKRLNSSLDGMWATIATKLGPVMGQFADKLTSLFERDWSKSDLFAFFSGPPSVSIARLAQYVANAKSRASATQSGPMGRVLPGLATSAPPGFVGSGDGEKLSKSELEALARFQNQATQIANDQARAFNSVAPSIEENTRALAAYFAKVNEENLGATQRVIELGSAYEEQFGRMSVYAEQAARSIQDAFAQFFMDFDKGIKGAAKSFLEAIKQMAAQLAASQLLNFLGGSLKGSSNSFLSGLGGLLIPGRAEGGPVTAGKPYIVGERGPEFFVPGMSGQILNGGAGTVYAPVMTFNIDSRSDRATILRDINSIVQENSRQMVQFLTDQKSRRGE